MTIHPKEPEFCQQYTKQKLLSPGNRTTGWHFSISEILAITFFATAHSFRAASELSPQRPALQKMERTKNVTEATAHFLQGRHTSCESIATELSNRVPGLDFAGVSLNSIQSGQRAKETRPSNLPRPQLARLGTKFSKIRVQVSA